MALLWKKGNHLYVSRKTCLTWLMAVCMVGSAGPHCAPRCERDRRGAKNGAGAKSFCLWQPPLLYALIVLLDGKGAFYKTAIPIWMLGLYFPVSA